MKDYTILRNKLTKESQITTKDILALGFSQYDIKQFVDNEILTKVSRGLYYYRPSLVEEPKQEEKVEEPIIETKPTINGEEIGKSLNAATTLMVKRETDQAICAFEEILNIDSSNQYARFAIFACYMFKRDFEIAYNKLIELYNNRTNNELLLNVYNYILL
jgi:tetratricopeptide (TPR) repeat protein